MSKTQILRLQDAKETLDCWQEEGSAGGMLHTNEQLVACIMSQPEPPALTGTNQQQLSHDQVALLEGAAQAMVSSGLRVEWPSLAAELPSVHANFNE